MRLLTGIFWLGISFSAAIALAGDSPTEQLRRGRYLVDGVGVCGDCHTPRNERGEPDRAAELQGAPIDFRPVHPMPQWAEYAPRIAGLPGMSHQDAVRLFETGDLNGRQMRPPMPPYRLNHEDAEAVVAYLRSLKAKTDEAAK